MRIGLDSNCVSYVIDGFASLAEPAGALAAEKLALIRAYFYLADCFWVTPQTRSECAQIPDVEQKLMHESFFSCLFPTATPDNDDQVLSLTNAFATRHSKLRDCRILAEASSVHFDVLITSDGDFVKRLGPIAYPVELLRPCGFWEKYQPSAGARLRNAPVPPQPLAAQSWWRI